ncbi:RNA polymerase sigma factor [Actinomadura sp. 21ATH]|uniref:RNA polymerase sigma factor n=1 Tax=Actinomadura sp. 21ATH TaxID=1735444 RepID=UPI0035BF5EE8
MRGDLGALYDAHAVRVHAHCWSLTGGAGAAAAVRDTFVAAVQHPPRGDTVLWLYALSRSACASLGAFGGTRPDLGDPGDPLLRAAAGLRPDQREALLLQAGEWLEAPDIARVLGIAPDTARALLATARTRLENAVLDLLMRGAADPARHAEVVAAFEKGRLPRLLAARVPDRPPAWLRDQVLAACEGEAGRPLTGVVSPSPLVVIGSEVADSPGRDRARRRKAFKGVGAVAGMAASVAAAVGMLVSWPTGKGGGVNAVVPSAGNSQAGGPSAGENAPTGSATRSGGPAADRGAGAPAPSAATEERQPATTVPPGTGNGAAPGGNAPAPETSAPEKSPETTAPPAGTTPPAPSAPEPTDPGEPAPPTDPADPSGPPATGQPTDPSQPPADPPGETPEPGPSPTSNPAPSPTTGG